MEGKKDRKEARKEKSRTSSPAPPPPPPPPPPRLCPHPCAPHAYLSSLQQNYMGVRVIIVNIICICHILTRMYKNVLSDPPPIGLT